MAETVVINIEANTQGLQSTIDLLTKLGVVEQKVADEFRKTNEQNVTSLNKGVQATTKEFEKLDKAVKGIKADNQLAKGLDASKEVAKTGASVTSLRKQFQQATKEVELLTEKFGALDARTIAAAQKAAQLSNEIGDINKQIAALTPEGKFQAIQNLGASIAGVFQVATGALQAFGVESEQATKIAQQFQGALNIFGGLSQLSQLKGSLDTVKAALGLTTAAQVANTTATEAGIVSTEGQAAANVTATTTFQALKAAVASNPFGAILIAITAVVGAIVLFTDSTEDATEAVNKLNDELADQEDFYNERVKNIERIGKAEVDNLETTLAVRKAEGAGIKELANLERDILNEKLENLRLRAQANSDAIKDDIKSRDALRGNDSEESVKLKAELDKRIKDRTDYYKDIELEANGLKNDILVLEAETTAALKKEAEQRAKDAEEAALKKKQAELGGVTKAPTISPAQAAEGIVPAPTEIQLVTTATFEVDPKFKTELDKLIEETKAKKEELQKTLIFSGIEAGIDTAFAYINKNLEDQIETANDIKEQQLAIIAEEEEALLQSYDNRRIGKRELELEQERLARERINAEKKAEKELNEIRKKQDLANRAQKVFEIGISTFRNVVEQPGLAGALIPYWIGLGAIQAAAVLAQPLPKYKKGTLSVGGVGSEDTELALLQPGEAVIPTETNRRYHPAIKAIYHGKIKPEDINNFVNLKLRGDYSASDARPVTAKMDTSDLYALGRIMKKNDGVYVRNINELAAIIADSYNPRR